MPEGSLRLLLDQNIPRELLPWLRQQRPEWTIEHVTEVGLDGKPDPEIFRWAQSHEALVMSYDEDFADTRSFPLGTHHGIVRLRVWPTTVEQTREALERLLRLVPEGELRGSLIIIDAGRIRLRRKS